MKRNEEIKDNQHHSRNEMECQTLEEEKAKQGNQSTTEAIGNYLKEVKAAKGELLSNDTHELMNPTVEVNEVGLDINSPAQTMAEREDDIARNSDKGPSHLMSKLGLTVTTIKDQERCSYKEGDVPKKVASLSLVVSHQDESRRLLHENDARASGRMSGLPEIREMLCKQEIHSARESLAQKDPQTYLLQDCTTEGENPTERVEMKYDIDLMFDPQQFAKFPDYGTHALETLRSSIVIRKQEVPVNKEADIESPNSHPTLALAIRNNQLVKLGKEDEFQRGERNTSALDPSHPEAILIDTKSTLDESILRNDTMNLIDERSHMQQARNPIYPPDSHTGTDSSGEESAYKGDSFEEDEEEEQVDEEPAHSEESCTNVGVRNTGSNNLEINEQFSPNSKIEGNQSRCLNESSENWESEQGSYSPEGDGTIADYFHEHTSDLITERLIPLNFESKV